jgi:CMP-N-acetylneuraminic acid synthetase
LIAGKSVLGLITARGGSKGLPGKNIRPAAGKPLIAWTIEAGLASKYLDRLVLSSDDDAIIAAARQYGCEVPFRRGAALAADDTSSIAVVTDALERCPGYDWVVLLQPTSPLRTAEDIDASLERCMAAGAPACVSVREAEESPYWMYWLREGAHLAPVLPERQFTRRQDLPPAYVLNGAVYVADVQWLLRTRTFLAAETVAYEMSPGRSLDIDTEADFLKFQTIVESR